MNKTCYFCQSYDDCEVYSDSDACDSNFQPNADWLEYEGLLQRIIELEIGEKLMEKEYESLKKENEELKKELQMMQWDKEEGW